MNNLLYEVPVKVCNGEGCGLPSDLSGATLVCYVAAKDALSAVSRAALAVESLKYRFEDLARPTVRELDVDQWDAYVRAAWPEDVDTFPAQAELPELIKRGIVFLGPVIGFLNP